MIAFFLSFLFLSPSISISNSSFFVSFRSYLAFFKCDFFFNNDLREPEITLRQLAKHFDDDDGALSHHRDVIGLFSFWIFLFSNSNFSKTFIFTLFRCFFGEKKRTFSFSNEVTWLNRLAKISFFGSEAKRRTNSSMNLVKNKLKFQVAVLKRPYKMTRVFQMAKDKLSSY